MMLHDDGHTIFRSSRVHVPTLSRAALNYECKVARAHARVCRGLATPLNRIEATIHVQQCLRTLYKISIW